MKNEHKVYREVEHFEGLRKYYLYDDYSGKIKEAKRRIRKDSDNVITIGKWQNELDEQGNFSIKIYGMGNKNILLDSEVILNLCKIIKRLK